MASTRVTKGGRPRKVSVLQARRAAFTDPKPGDRSVKMPGSQSGSKSYPR